MAKADGIRTLATDKFTQQTFSPTPSRSTIDIPLMLYRSILRPALFRLPAETAHEIGLHALSAGFSTDLSRQLAAQRFQRSPFGQLERFSLKFSNPIGLAAGFDKNGTVAQAIEALGFGFVEVGTVTNIAQPGNPRPRLFRLSIDRALVNRAGFNNDGAESLAQRLKKARPNCVLGVNIGKSRVVPVEEAVPDYLACFDKIYDVADFIVVNVSSPNTPNLRELQKGRELEALLGALQNRNRELGERKSHDGLPLLVKISPDLDAGELETIVEVAASLKLAGIIATNTTTSRAGLQSPPDIVEACGAGGLSGAPLRARSTEIIASLSRLAKNRLTIIGVGGIFSAMDAWEKIRAGASLVQLYTGFVYQGLGVARDLNDGLEKLLAESEYKTFDEAVGSALS